MQFSRPCSQAFSSRFAAAIHRQEISLCSSSGTPLMMQEPTTTSTPLPASEPTPFPIESDRFSDGRLIADFIAEYAKLLLILPYLQMKDDEFMGEANFASAGASALIDTYEGFVVSFMMQLKQFEKLEKKLSKRLGNEEAKRVISGAVYFISVGNNDYLMLIYRNPTLFQLSSIKEYVGTVIGNIITVLEVYFWIRLKHV
ncbi:hypothetical protein EUGRSUZ_I02154 [Eucalyptus grandis]|uniref:Uncharacterized protein n=2 Tax=Eucalyptus grandis TaxID=71139 RepID=A0ACC3JJC3_EUCGR|nr:hypothetical protein EUGRSUZ_I02154 [Eucalyptus grandis]